MEFAQVIGKRRSVRYFETARPVERRKIQTVLEAARLCSRAMNVPWGKGLVVYHEQLTQEERDRLKTPFAGAEFDLAPVYILWYYDLDASRIALEGARYPAVPSGVLQDIAAYGPPHGWSHKYVSEVVLPEVLMPGLGRGPQRGGNADAALALEQAHLAAIDEGLAACLVPFDEAGAAELFKVPDYWEPVMALLLGYSVESLEAGGQEPRKPWDEVCFDGNVHTPFRRDPEVTAELERAGMIQTPAPLPWRAAEVRALSRGFGLPGGDAVEEDSR